MEWNEKTLQTVLDELRTRRGDSSAIEVKTAAGGVPKMTETFCAFANMPNGGTVILGVSEANGSFEIVGVPNVSACEAGLVSQVRNAVKPPPKLSFQTVEVSGKNVVVVEVTPLPVADKPAYYQSQAYLRQADGDYPLHQYEIRMLETLKLKVDEQVDYDLKPVVGKTIEDLDQSLVAQYIASVRAHDRRLKDLDEHEILWMTNVTKKDGTPTLAGYYALGFYPQSAYPSLGVTAAVQLPGGEGQPRTRNLEDFSGPVPVLLDQTMDWMALNLDRVRRYRADGHMEEAIEFPLNAIRELVANALIHRDLSPNTLGVGKSIQIRLNSDQLFIQSPGGLRGISLAQLESVEHAQAAVNQRLYQIAKRLVTSDSMAVIEGEGGGIQEVFRSLKDRGLPKPRLVDTGVQFTAVLWRDGHAAERVPVLASQRWSSAIENLKDKGKMTGIREKTVPESNDSLIPESSAPTKNERLVLSGLKQVGSGGATIRELSQATGLGDRQVRYALQQPIQDNLVEMLGQRGIKDTHYRLKQW